LGGGGVGGGLGWVGGGFFWVFFLAKETLGKRGKFEKTTTLLRRTKGAPKKNPVPGVIVKHFWKVPPRGGGNVQRRHVGANLMFREPGGGRKRINKKARGNLKKMSPACRGGYLSPKVKKRKTKPGSQGGGKKDKPKKGSFQDPKKQNRDNGSSINLSPWQKAGGKSRWRKQRGGNIPPQKESNSSRKGGIRGRFIRKRLGEKLKNSKKNGRGGENPQKGIIIPHQHPAKTLGEPSLGGTGGPRRKTGTSRETREEINAGGMFWGGGGFQKKKKSRT